MNIANKQWYQLQQELPIFIYLAISQTILTFTWPSIINLPRPFNILLALVLNTVCILIYGNIIMYPEKYTFAINLEFLDHSSQSKFLKTTLQFFRFFMFNYIYFYVWYKNLYHVPNKFYIIYYLHSVSVLTLLYRVLNRHTIKYTDPSTSEL